jgi:hypothetical protein
LEISKGREPIGDDSRFLSKKGMGLEESNSLDKRTPEIQQTRQTTRVMSRKREDFEQNHRTCSLSKESRGG